MKKKSFVIFLFLILILSLFFVSANHRKDIQDEKIYLDEWLDNLWGKITGNPIFQRGSNPTPSLAPIENNQNRNLFSRAQSSQIQTTSTALPDKEISREITKKSEEIKRLNLELVELNDKYSKTLPIRFARKKEVSNELDKLAIERQENMIELAKENPTLFLNNVIPEEKRELFPEEIKEHIEEKKIIKGRLLTVHIDDFVNHKPISKYRYFFITDNNEKIYFYTPLNIGYISGAEGIISGYQIDKHVVGFINVKKIKTNKEKTSKTFLKNTGEIIKYPYPTIPQTCIDTDLGKDHYTKGTITVNGRTEVDSCNLDGTLREWYCGTPGDPAGLLRSENFVSCPGGSCKEGVCSKEHKIAVFLVNFLDSPIDPEPFTPTEAHDLIFNDQFQNFYHEQSYNKIHFSGDIFGWITSSDASAGCGEPLGLGSDLDYFIINNNIDLNNYDHILILGQGCGLAGQSSIGPWFTPITLGNQTYNISLSWAWSGVGEGEAFTDPSFFSLTSSFWKTFPPNFSWTNLDFILSHEIGHAMGLGHANGYDCSNKSLDNPANCQHFEYGNIFDSMGLGTGAAFHFSAQNKEFLDLISSQEILTINQSGNYTLNVFETSGREKFAKIQLIGSNSFPYYLEYRKGIGFDSSLNNQDLISNQNGLLINKYRDGFFYDEIFWYPPSTGFLDMNATSLDWIDDLESASLSGNNVFNDQRRGLTIGPIISYTPTNITFNVNLQQTNCVREPPIIISEDSKDKKIYNLDNMQYLAIIFNIYNNDYPICDISSFRREVIIQSGFSLFEFDPSFIVSAKPEEQLPILFSHAVISVSPDTCSGIYPVLFIVENLDSGLITTKTIMVEVVGGLCAQVLPEEL